MPHTPRCKCIDCERVFDSNEVREVGDGLLRLFLAVRLSKRISSNDVICQKCRCQFLNWEKKMEGDFKKFDCLARPDIESVNNDENTVRNDCF
jgi:hypothetical protein